MSRKVDLQEEKLVITLTGLTSIAALKHNVEIPYSAIKKITTGEFTTSSLIPRLGTAGLGNDLREGRFLIDGEWCFLSYEKHDKVVILELEGLDYRNVIFEVENPEEMKLAILEKCSP